MEPELNPPLTPAEVDLLLDHLAFDGRPARLSCETIPRDVLYQVIDEFIRRHHEP